MRTHNIEDLNDEQRAAAVAQLDIFSDIINDIVIERVLQDEQWGGAYVDDSRTGWQWVTYISKQTQRVMASFQLGGEPLSDGEFRYTMVKIAALATAAVQAYDRVTAADAEKRAAYEADKACSPDPERCPCFLCELEREMGEPMPLESRALLSVILGPLRR